MRSEPQSEARIKRVEHMTYASYWLLETAATFRVPICCLVDPKIEALFNKPGHGLGRDELAGVLVDLLRLDDIVIADAARGTYPPSIVEIKQSLVERSRDDRSHGAFYGLTSQGGARWEIAAKADWDRYISTSFVDLDEKLDDAMLWSCELSCAHREPLEKYLSILRSMDEHQVISGTERWDVLEHWQATYWKQLSSGYRVRYLGTGIDALGWTAYDDALAELTRWYQPPHFSR